MDGYCTPAGFWILSRDDFTRRFFPIMSAAARSLGGNMLTNEFRRASLAFAAPLVASLVASLGYGCTGKIGGGETGTGGSASSGTGNASGTGTGNSSASVPRLWGTGNSSGTGNASGTGTGNASGTGTGGSSSTGAGGTTIITPDAGSNADAGGVTVGPTTSRPPWRPPPVAKSRAW